MVVATSLLCVSSCGDPQELVSITVQPQTETFGASNIPVSSLAGAQVQLSALGTYVHPPVTKDITDQVTWSSNTPQMVTVNSAGLITVVGGPCGATLVSATVQTNADASGVSSQGAIVTGYMTANVTCFSGSTTGVNTDALTLTFPGSGSGTVTSSPSGLSCASPLPCAGAFEPGTTVTLTASPNNGSTFGSWTGCESPSNTNPCSVTMTGNQTVSVVFN
jgi:Divergent InlB B-repeat domain